MGSRQHFNEEPGLSGEISVTFDVATGKIYVRGVGFWSYAQTMAFFDDWKQIVAHMHSAYGPICALVDMSESAVQKADVASIIATATAGLYKGDDTIAMLVPNSLAKMQMRRLLDCRFHAFFISRSAAVTWLDSRNTSQVQQQPCVSTGYEPQTHK